MAAKPCNDLYVALICKTGEEEEHSKQICLAIFIFEAIVIVTCCLSGLVVLHSAWFVWQPS